MPRNLPSSASRRRTGATLIVVLILLAVLGALAAGSFFAALHDEQIESAALLRARALAAAEHAVYTAITPRHWRAAWAGAPPGRQVASDTERLPGGASATTNVWMLTPFSALVVAHGVAGLPPRDAHRRVALLLSLHPPVMPGAAAIARSALSVLEGSSVIGGTDDASVDCLTPDADVAAISVPSAVSIDTGRCTPLPCLRSARVVRDTILAARAEMSEQFGQVNRSFLATIGSQISPGLDLSPAPVLGVDGACDANAPANLGDPTHVLGPDSPCASFYPVVHGIGDLRLTGGAGQGILVVDGDLTLAAGARFTGVLLVRGTARLEGGSRLEGIVIADRVSLTGASEIRYSACAVNSAVRSGTRPIPEANHSWTEMF